MSTLDISFEGFWQCRLATDPDPSDEQKGISGFTYSIAGETLLEPSFWSQAKDIESAYGTKDSAFVDTTSQHEQREIKNIREASPDFQTYNEKGIGIRVTEVKWNGIKSPSLTQSLAGSLVRFEGNPNIKDYKWRGPIFEGRNQIVSDGDPDRFTLTPFVISLSDQEHDEAFLRRFDPLDMDHPYDQLYTIFPNDPLVRRLPVQRFAMSQELLDELGISDLDNHFVNRANWLKSKVMEAEANGQDALAEAFKSRLFAVNFFTKATGPTVLENRLLSRVSLRQLYHHTIRGTEDMLPAPMVNQSYFGPYQVDVTKDWDILYYLGGYDGDLMSGWCTGTLSLPVID